MSESESPVDLLVLGGGMAGLSAAAYAARNAASVVLIEKAPVVGGTAAYARYIHTAPTVEVMREVNPGADPKLSTRLVEGYDGAIEWVRSLGIHMDDPVPVIGYSRGRHTDIANYLLACERLVREHGELLVSSTAERLLREEAPSSARSFGPLAASSASSGRVRRCWRPAGSAATPNCGQSTSIRSRATCRCARTSTAPATGFVSASPPARRSGRRMPGSTATSSRPASPTRTRTNSRR